MRQAKLNAEIKKHLTQILLEVTDAVLGGLGVVLSVGSSVAA